MDTGSGTSVAAGELVHGNFELLAFTEFADPFGHAENIGLAIRETLAAAHWQPDSMHLLAANQGPAAYTGLRVGLAAVTAYAAVRNLPLLGISSLVAAAYEFLRGNPAETHCSVALEAKRKELFFQSFQRDTLSPWPVELTDAKLLPVGELPTPLPGNWAIKPADARAVAELALRRWQQSGEAGGILAQYLRQPDVTPGAGKRVSG